MAFRRTLGQVFLKRQLKCAMEACGSSHHWGWEIAKLGPEVRLLPPVKRQKDDAADAEAASRPTIVAVKEQQSHGMMRRSLFVRQRTALRSHPSSVSRLPKALPTSGSSKRRRWHLLPIRCIRSQPIF